MLKAFLPSVIRSCARLPTAKTSRIQACSCRKLSTDNGYIHKSLVPTEVIIYGRLIFFHQFQKCHHLNIFSINANACTDTHWVDELLKDDTKSICSLYNARSHVYVPPWPVNINVDLMLIQCVFLLAHIECAFLPSHKNPGEWRFNCISWLSNNLHLRN